MLDAQDLNNFDANIVADTASLGGGNANNGGGSGGGGGGGGGGRSNFKNNRNFGGNNQVSKLLFNSYENAAFFCLK